MARLAFFGTPEFAVPSLEALLHLGHHEIVCVVCQPDRPKGRGKAVQAPPVKICAQNENLPVLQPATLKKGTPDGEDFYHTFQALSVDLAVVTAYGRIIPRRVLEIPRRGFVNVHASLLPRWRGAAPIQRCIEAGEQFTGVCLMDMVYELDAGDVYAVQRLPIEPQDTSAELTTRLAALGKSMLIEHLDDILTGRLEKTPQDESQVTYAHMLRKEEGRLDWQKSTYELRNHVRAMHPWPGSYTMFKGEVLKLFDPTEVATEQTHVPGTVLQNTPRLVVSTKDGAIAFGEGQFQGKKRLTFDVLSRGKEVPVGTVLDKFEDE